MTLEELLNKLIKKGWKVYHRNYNKCVNVWRNCAYFMYRDEYWRPMSDKSFFLRELVAKESWLWQFVCENGMTTLQIEYNNRKTPERWVRYHWNKHSNVIQEDERLTKERKRNENYEYRLIESALCDEDKLEEFLLENIKVE